MMNLNKNDNELLEEYKKVVKVKKQAKNTDEHIKLWNILVSYREVFKNRGYRVTTYADRVVITKSGKRFFRYFL